MLDETVVVMIVAANGLLMIAFIAIALRVVGDGLIASLKESLRAPSHAVHLIAQQNEHSLNQMTITLAQIRQRLISIEACLGLDTPYLGA
jgi:hypothetical protein